MIRSETVRIVLFDGVCDLCNGFVQFIIKRDHKAKFKFAALQSAAAQELLIGTQLDPADLETVVYIRGDRTYTKSGAALRILRDLGGIWSLFRLKLIIPPFIRDLFYSALAKRRYKLFGKMESCMVPTPELQERFIR